MYFKKSLSFNLLTLIVICSSLLISVAKNVSAEDTLRTNGSKITEFKMNCKFPKVKAKLTVIKEHREGHGWVKCTVDILNLNFKHQETELKGLGASKDLFFSIPRGNCEASNFVLRFQWQCFGYTQGLDDATVMLEINNQR